MTNSTARDHRITRDMLEAVPSTKAAMQTGALRVSCHVHGLLGADFDTARAVQAVLDHADCGPQ